MVAVIQEAWIGDVSTRGFDDLVQAMGLSGLSRSTVSKLCKDIDERGGEFLNRSFTGEWPYVWLGATYLKLHQGGRIVPVAAIIAVAANTDGRREIIGLAIGPLETETFWTEFLRPLNARGLGGGLVISNAHTPQRRRRPGWMAMSKPSPSSEACRCRYSMIMTAARFRRSCLTGHVGASHCSVGSSRTSLHFAAEDMKDRRARTAPFPAELAPAMQRYLEHHRLELLDGRTSDHLWISQYGEPITADGLSRELPKVTERHFGVALRPHAFRHVAATSIAKTAPEHVGIIRDILGHATLDMSQKHYNRAKGITSCNAYQDVVSRILDSRSKVRPEKHPSGPRGPKR